MVASIVALQGPLAGQMFQLSDSPCSFGRDSRSTVVITSRLASRRHAEIRCEAGNFVLNDCSSRNGTKLNNTWTRTQSLKQGDEITIGDEVFRFDLYAEDVEQTQIPLPSGTITFLFTDIEGSTRLWEQAPAAMDLALQRHDTLIEMLAAQNYGIVVRPRGEGDSRFVVFARASDAVRAAYAIQIALGSEIWPTPQPLRVRMALHTGEADLRNGDYYGSAVNRCARIRSIARGGQTLMSLATTVLATDALPAGAQLHDLGEQPLKDMRRAERIFQLSSCGSSHSTEALHIGGIENDASEVPVRRNARPILQSANA